MNAKLAAILGAACAAIAGPAAAQADPDQGFVPGPPASESLPADAATTPPTDTGPAPAPPTTATEVLLADTWNTAACGFTDTASFSLATPVRLSRFALWYNWRAGESQVRFTVALNGQAAGQGVLTRGDCDPYQGAWCEARGAPAAQIPAGRYTFRLESARVCQNAASGGAGFIRAWGYVIGG